VLGDVNDTGEANSPRYGLLTQTGRAGLRPQDGEYATVWRQPTITRPSPGRPTLNKHPLDSPLVSQTRPAQIFQNKEG
jgi:hypothetical protein